jgi:hypothetical protein
VGILLFIDHSQSSLTIPKQPGFFRQILGMAIDGRIAQANGRLKAGGIKVTIERHGQKLHLRATLPPKPGLHQAGSLQQRIAIGYNANPEGIKLAEQEARFIDAQIQRNQFDWSLYVKNSVQVPLIVADWITKFEQDYFTRRQRNPKSETTWKDELSHN